MKMNKLTKIIVALIVAVIVLDGCKKEESLQYSCNPEINQWVAENKGSFCDITRKQLAVIPPYLQVPIYRSLSAQKKHDFWVEKLELITSDWDEPVRIFIERLKQDIGPEWFSETTPDYVTQYIEKAEYEILTTLMDTSDYVVNFCTISTAEEIEYYINHSDDIDYSWLPNHSFALGIMESKEPVLPDCYCRWNQYCHGFWPDDDCKHGGCSTSSSGCGFLNLMSCKGLCPFLESTKPQQDGQGNV